MSKFVTTAPLKKSPCDHCRQRKRRCSYENPCERCKKLNVRCVYTVLTSPKDLEYLQELEYIEQVKLMEQQLVVLEKEIDTVKLAKNSSDEPPLICETYMTVTDYPSPTSLHSQSTKSFDDEQLVRSIQQEIINRVERQKVILIAKHNQTEATLTEQEDDAKPWQLTLKNGNFEIDTYINSYSDLMNNLNNMLLTQKHTMHPTVQTNIQYFIGNSITDTLTLVMWKKYGKSRLKSMVRHKPLFLQNLEAKNSTTIVSLDTLNSLTYQIIRAYIHCLHTKEFAIHSRSFVELFMSNQQDIMRSPAVMALCSDVCQRPCKHILKIVPVEAAADYAQYYFEQARDLISDQFDESNLETLTTYIFMASYTTKAKSYEDAKKYLSLAECIYNTLLPFFEANMKKDTASSEARMFSRLCRSVDYIKHIIDMHSFSKEENNKKKIIHKAITFPNHSGHSTIYHAQTESIREANFAILKNSLLTLRDSVKDAAKTSFAYDIHSYADIFTHQIEMAIRYWYNHKIPKSFRLSLFLFEDVDDLDYFIILERECPRETPFVILSSIYAYNEYLIASKTFFPKVLEKKTIKTEEMLELFYKMESELPDDYDKKYSFSYPSNFLIKMKHIRNHHLKEFMNDYEGTEDDYFRELVGAINPGKSVFDAPYIKTTIIAAFNVIRLIQFLNNHECSCFFEIGWIINAWEVLRRSMKFESKLSKVGRITPDRIKANMLLCIQLLEDLANFTQNHSAHNFVDMMKEEFQKSV